MAGHALDALFVGASVSEQVVDAERLEAVLRHVERRLRNVDELNQEKALLRAAEQDGELVAAAAAKLREADGARQRREDLAREADEEGRLGARDAVPREPADGLEQRRPELVVEVLRRQLPRGALQVLADVGRKGRGALLRAGRHSSPTHRNAA